MKLLIIDSHALVHRAYHALPVLTTHDGKLINAVYGFLLVFLRAIKEIQPECIVATFDFPGPSFRQKKFKDYKAKRPKAPDELYNQIPIIKEILAAFKVPISEKQGFEADDLIATIAKLTQRQQVLPAPEIFILTGDLDALQLVNENIKVYALGRGIKETIIYDQEKVKERFKVLPSQIIDFKALAGDPSDNIPGATGIGQKTAAELLKEHGSVSQLYQAIDKAEAWDLKPKTKELLLNYKEQVFFSYDLARARDDAPIDFKLEECHWQGYNKQEVVDIFKKYNFYSLIDRLP